MRVDRKKTLIPIMLCIYFFVLIKGELLHYYEEDMVRNISVFLVMLSLPYGILFILNKLCRAMGYILSRRDKSG